MNIRTPTSLAASLLGIALFVGGLVILPNQARPSAAAQVPTPSAEPLRRTVSVSGSGSAEAQPDLAYIILGVQTDAESASAALNQNNQQMQSLLAALRAAGVAQADIRTRTIQLYPRYETPNQGPRPTPGAPQLVGYNAINTVEVRVRDLDTLGDLLDQAVTAGSNQIENIRFDLSNPTQALDSARASAMGDARRKAEQLAELAGAELGGVIAINESSYFPVPAAREAVMMDQAASSVPISPGQQTLTIDVQVTWELHVQAGAASP